LKPKHGLFFIAVFLSAVAPAFADKIAADLKDGDGDYVAIQGSPHKQVLQRTFAFCISGRIIFKEGEFSCELKPVVRISNFGKDGKIADLGSPLTSEWDTDNSRVSLLGLSFIHVDSAGRNDEKSRAKHRERDSDDGHAPTLTVAAPEPGSLTFLLFGLAVSGMIVYRRNSQQNAI
jgi:hypothetical protein